MSRYIEFETENGGIVLVEVEDAELAAPTGVAKAGLLRKTPTDSVAKAQASFDEAITNAVRHNVHSLTAAVQGLAPRPTEVELMFGLKATGEVGNIAIAKVGGEATFTLRLVWKDPETDS